MKSCLIVIAMLVGAGCSGPEVVSDFTNFNKEAFLAACTQTTADVAIDDEVAVVDSQTTTDICECVFERLSDDMSFEEFEELDKLLQESVDAPLPAELRESVSGCLIAELGL